MVGNVICYLLTIGNITMKILLVLGVFISGYIWAIIDSIWIFVKGHWIISSIITLFIIMSLIETKDDKNIEIDSTENNSIENTEDKIPSEKKDSMEKDYNPVKKNKKTVYFFRFILILFILTLIISPILDIFLIDTLPRTLQQYLSSQYQDMGNINNKEVALTILLMSTITVLFTIFFIGVWNFKRWARTLFIILTIIFLPFILIEDAFVMVPLANMFVNVGNILTGMLLVLMYTEPVKSCFSKKKSD